MPVSKRRKTNKGGSRNNSRAATPVPTSRSSSPIPNVSAKTILGKTTSKPLNPPLVLTSEKRRGVFECDYCHSDISQIPRIRCAECPDFDLCLECFLTTDHTSAIARLRASVEARTAVDNLNAAGGHQHSQHQGKQAPVGSLGGGGEETASAPLSSAWHTGSGAINHDETHGYRVCDNTRYPMFPSSRNLKPNVNINDGGATAGASSSRASASGEEEEEKNENKDEDIMEVDTEDKHESTVDGESKTSDLASSKSPISQDVVFVTDDPKAIWTVEEDLRLLDAIETQGLGNWTDVAEAVSGQGSSGKTPKRCMERYFDDFLGRYGHILPPYTLVEDASEEKEEADGSNLNNGDNKDGAPTDGGAGSASKDLDPTRLSKRRHSIMMRTNSSASMQSLGRFSKKLKPVPTESLPEFQIVQNYFPNPKIPPKKPAVTFGQEVGRDASYKAELMFLKNLQSLSAEDAQRVRKEWMESKYMKPGGPTVLPERPEDVVQLPGAELAGFMPRRGDFDIEWENDAEQALADMEFLPGDLEADKELKLKVLHIYNEKLDERENRKKFILERELYDYRKNQEEEAKLTRDERDLVRRMRLFERFHTAEEHKKFVEDILRAKQLRKEIAKLQMYRRMGIFSLAEAEKYELDKSRRKFHKAAVSQKEAAAKQNGAQGAFSAAADAAAAAGASSSGKNQDRSGDDVNDSLWKGYRNNDRSGRRRSVSRLQENTAAAAKDSSPPEAPDNAATSGNDKEPTTDSKSKEKAQETNTDAGADGKGQDAGSAPAIASGEFAIDEMDGFDYLSEKEANLCRKIQLTPKQYMDVKKILIHESLNKGLLDKKEGSSSRRTLVTIDVEKRGNVIDFMVQAGWLNKAGTMARAISE